ncbi:MAG: HD domain-containing protein [Spirochaetales bacterium]|jgi:HD-GYP domain-containing protein (c-di-GMP phosphodiesterase class II)|nr:HD domain-containing protein [Spirochaetales bacterium]
MSIDKRDLRELLRVIQNLHRIQDSNLLLEHILHEARIFVNADAGTLYRISDDRLYFTHIENESLFPDGKRENKYLYTNRSIPLSRDSLAGFVAATGEPIIIDDVYDLPDDLDYRFNPEFDKKTNYKTISQLVIPLRKGGGDIVGVIQLINAKDNDGKVIPFSVNDRLYITYFAEHAALAIERTELARDMVMRMVEMAELRDPNETTHHARRVGEYSLVLYDRYAKAHGVSLAERNIKKDIFRAAAILHDIGKAGVDHSILAKNGHLSDKEKLLMYQHTIYGARLFRNRTSYWDKIAAEVALSHHERWDGSGYPGHIENLNVGNIVFGPGKREKEIPLSGRIVAIADVFDALISKRSYKDSWTEEAAFQYMKGKAGKHFDPELIGYFLEMKPILKAIRKNL